RPASLSFAKKRLGPAPTAIRNALMVLLMAILRYTKPPTEISSPGKPSASLRLRARVFPVGLTRKHGNPRFAACRYLASLVGYGGMLAPQRKANTSHTNTASSSDPLLAAPTFRCG